jgi:hypothetical protein
MATAQRAIWFQSSGEQLYRFVDPENKKYPETSEIFSRKTPNIDLA